MNAIHELEEEIRRAIEAARRACVEPRWNEWAERWLAQLDRSAESAHRAACDARLASGRPNAEDLHEHEAYVSHGRDGPGLRADFYLDVAKMEHTETRFAATEPMHADREAERAKRSMTAAELAAYAAALAVGAMGSSEFVAERIGPLALRHAREAQQLAYSI